MSEPIAGFDPEVQVLLSVQVVKFDAGEGCRPQRQRFSTVGSNEKIVARINKAAPSTRSRSDGNLT